MKPLPKPQDMNEIMPNAFQTIDLQGLMQGIYKKTEDIFNQLNEKLAQSNETIAKLKEFIIKHSQIIENLQGKIAGLEQENFTLKNSHENYEENNYNLKEIKDLNNEICRLNEKIAEKDEKIKILQLDLRENQEKNEEIKIHAERLERDLLENKVKISEAMNQAFESGGPDLVEFLEKTMLSLESK